MKARRIIVLSLAAAATLSCGKESADRGGGAVAEGAINFATRIDAASTPSRGAILERAAGLAAAGGFNVWAIGHPGEWDTNPSPKTTIMNALPVTSPDGVEWSYGEAKEWPMDKYLTFFAYGPRASANAVTSAADGTPTIDFTVEPDVADHTDLVVAVPVKNQAGANYSYSKPVMLEFKHALSRISFSGLRVDPTDTREIYVKEITLSGLYGNGTARMADPVVWAPYGARTSYTAAIATGELVPAIPANALDNTGKKLTTDAGYMFLIPQTLARTANDPTMEVTLDVDGEQLSYSTNLFSPKAWEAGKSYNYQIVIDGNELRVIYIDSDNISLDNWDGSIVLQTIVLSSTDGNYDDVKINAANLAFAMNKLNEINRNAQSGTNNYPYFGVYAVNDLSHDIVVNIGQLLPGGGSYFSGQHLIFDLKKMVRTWNTNPADGNRPWTFSVTDYDGWTLVKAMQPVDTTTSTPPNSMVDWDEVELTMIDGVTSASLPATFPVKQEFIETVGSDKITIPASPIIAAKGSIILQKQ